MTQPASLADRVTHRIRQVGPELVELSHRIHDHPELGLAEFEAVAAVQKMLEKQGYVAEAGYGGLQTAFRADAGEAQPRIAVLAEYDALPSIGHGCGHNVICAVAVGAFLGAASVVDSLGGAVALIGTPSEEIHSGKVLLLDNFAFEDVDAAVMIHPWPGPDAAVFRSLGVRTVTVTFHGVPSHAAAAPAAGRNALDATVFAYQGIASLRQHIPDTARIHGVIVDGGAAANIVPDHSSASFLVRADSVEGLSQLSRRVDDIFLGAALMTGTKVTTEWDSEHCNLPINNNFKLLDRYAHHMTGLGRPVDPNSQTAGAGASTDFGNLSQRLPAIHPAIGIAPLGIAPHSPEFAAAAASPSGDQAIVDGAIALALTMVDFLVDQELRDEVRAEFEEGGRVHPA